MRYLLLAVTVALAACSGPLQPTTVSSTTLYPTGASWAKRHANMRCVATLVQPGQPIYGVLLDGSGRWLGQGVLLASTTPLPPGYFAMEISYCNPRGLQ